MSRDDVLYRCFKTWVDSANLQKSDMIQSLYDMANGVPDEAAVRRWHAMPTEELRTTVLDQAKGMVRKGGFQCAYITHISQLDPNT
jgi:hypothetical protein